MLSSDDPVRVYQQFATLDLLSGGRAEIMAGRGSFIESFPLFGYDLNDYDELFAEKLELLLAIRASERVTWQGRLRAPLKNLGVYPRALQDPLPVWIAVGGTPQSIARAGALGLPLALAIIGGEPARFAPMAQLYREAAKRAGHDPATLALGINGHGFLADTAEAATAAFFQPYAETMSRIGRERGWPGLTRDQFEAGRSPTGHLTVGTPARGDRQDPRPARDLRPPALSDADARRADAAQGGHAIDRTVWDGGRAGGEEGAGAKRRAPLQ